MAKVRDLEPHALEAERALLGSLLVDNGLFDDVADAVSSGDFYDPRNRSVFSATAALLAKGRPADLVTVADLIARTSAVERFGGGLASYLSELTDAGIATATGPYHAKLVRDRAIMRELGKMGRDLTELSKAGEPEEALEAADSALTAIRDRRSGDAEDQAEIAELVGRAFKRIEAAHLSRGKLIGLSTGLADLDARTGGLEPCELIVLGARPGVGKTSLAITVADAVAVTAKVPTLFFTLEMGRDQIVDRLIAARSGVPLEGMRAGKLAQEHLPMIAAASGELAEAPLVICETTGITPTAVRARARREHRRRPLGLIVVDYLQLMAGAGDNREQEVSGCSKALKRLAKELRCPVVVLSQLSREVEKRKPPIPRESDLRESGSIEADADKILLLFRPPMWSDKARRRWPGEARLIVSKNRNGPTGSCALHFDAEAATFRNAEHTSSEEGAE